MDIDDAHIGHRIREIRTWRGMKLEATAQLAGITHAYLSMIERGQRPVTKRATLEAIARALRVSPAELTTQSVGTTDPATSEAHAGIAELEAAFEVYELGVDPEIDPRPWPELVQARHESEALREQADYVAQGAQLPRLLGELHATYVREPERRTEVLKALICSYRSAAWLCKGLAVRGLPTLAVRAAQTCAEKLDEPEWLGFTTYLRGIMGGQYNRPNQYAQSVRAADALSDDLDNPHVIQVTGTLHLLAALACAAQSDPDGTQDHLDEADQLANRLDTNTPDFGGGLHFGTANVGLWRVTLGTELGQGGKVAEAARNAHPEDVPIAGWRSCFYADLGRSLVTERATREQGLQAIIKAEQLAPQWLRNNAYVRDTVTSLLGNARREAGGRDLRGLAHRMGVAPTG